MKFKCDCCVCVFYIFFLLKCVCVCLRCDTHCVYYVNKDRLLCWATISVERLVSFFWNSIDQWNTISNQVYCVWIYSYSFAIPHSMGRSFRATGQSESYSLSFNDRSNGKSRCCQRTVLSTWANKNKQINVFHIWTIWFAYSLTILEEETAVARFFRLVEVLRYHIDRTHTHKHTIDGRKNKINKSVDTFAIQCNVYAVNSINSLNHYINLFGSFAVHEFCVWHFELWMWLMFPIVCDLSCVSSDMEAFKAEKFWIIFTIKIIYLSLICNVSATIFLFSKQKTKPYSCCILWKTTTQRTSFRAFSLDLSILSGWLHILWLFEFFVFILQN